MSFQTVFPADPRRRDIAVAVGFVVLTILFSWPLPVQLSSHTLGRGTDPELLMWALGWNAHAFLHQPFAIFDANIFYPSRYALAYSENMLGSALFVAPIIWVTGDLVFAMNLTQLSSIALSGIGAYLLARRLGLDVAPAIIAGLIFGFAPARFFRMPQAHLTTIQWIPFCLAFLHAYFSGGRARHLKLAALFFSLQALASGHGAVFLSVAAAGLVAWRLASGMPLQFARRVRELGVTGGLLLLPAVALLVPYRAARAEVPGLRRVLGDYGSSLASYVSSPVPFHQWLFNQLPPWLVAAPPDAHLFPGCGPLLLALVALVVWFRNSGNGRLHAEGAGRWWRHPVAFYGALALVSFWFTLGPPLGLWQFTYALPVFSFLRVPSRFVLLEVLALGIVAAFGARWLAAWIAPTRQAAVTAMLALGVILEFFPWGLAPLPFQIETTSADRWLASQPKPFVVAEFPVPDSRDDTTQARRSTLFMQHSTAHWQKLVHGYSGAEPAHYTALREHLMRFPDQASLEALADLGVTYVVMHPYLYERDQVDLAEVERRFSQYRDWLRIEYVSRDGRVYSLRRPEP